MAGGPKHVSNPLTLIAIFSGVSESVSAVVLPFLDASSQSLFIWFVMGFPTLLVCLFFFALWHKREIFYAPSDFKDERHFMAIVGYAERKESSERLHKYWKPDGVINPENELILRKWLSKNDLDGESLSFFLSGDKYATNRDKAVTDLNLS